MCPHGPCPGECCDRCDLAGVPPAEQPADCTSETPREQLGLPGLRVLDKWVNKVMTGTIREAEEEGEITGEAGKKRDRERHRDKGRRQKVRRRWT